MQKKFYITTPIYYVNDVPHIGHVYSTVVADVLARWHRMQGEQVYFVTGTDENAQKNAEVALQKNKETRKQGNKSERDVVQEYVDVMSAKWQMTWKELGFSNDDFIRTTEARHIAGVEKFWNAVHATGDIYKGKYVGLYCTGCEAYVVESDLVGGKCPLHKKEPKKLEEENYFFKASKYRSALLKHIAAHPEFVQPTSRRNEIVQYIEHHFTDFSISRQALSWGISVPGDSKQVLYVWFDALLNYCTAVGYGTDETKFKKFWPADVHLVGKDIIKFHCALWPAMLLSAGLPLPKTVFAHGFFTINGQKISKSLGNAIDPVQLVKKYSVDAVRYFLLREIPFGEDGDFSIERLAERYDADLASGLGNLVARVTTMAFKEKRVTFGIQNEALKMKIEQTKAQYNALMNEFKFNDVLAVIWELIGFCDRYIEQEKPWQQGNTNKNNVLGDLVAALIEIVDLLEPFMPDTTQKINAQLGSAMKSDDTIYYQPKKGASLFPRLMQ